MKYRISHTTVYRYGNDAAISFNEARLKPRTFDGQRCLSFTLDMAPGWLDRNESVDFFGNDVVFFTVQEHPMLEVSSRSVVDVNTPRVDDGAAEVSWESVRDFSRGVSPEALSDAHPFLYDSPFVKRSPELAKYAAVSFPAGRPYLEAVKDLTGRIHRDFAFVPYATTTRTPLLEIVQNRRGVCQDFAHVQVGCLRSLGLPARYVSGYLETLPPEGEKKLLGTDASHAWISVFMPSHGWIGFDPTNDLMVSDRHVTLAWGRDYGDVMPLNGIYWGSGNQSLSVAVDVSPA